MENLAHYYNLELEIPVRKQYRSKSDAIVYRQFVRSIKQANRVIRSLVQ